MTYVTKQWKENDAGMWVPYVDAGDGNGPIECLWTPYPGSQECFLADPVYESLLGGSRGGGKSAALLWSFAQHCQRGFGVAWRGIILRRQKDQLDELVKLSREIFPIAFPGIEFNIILKTWTWPSGETLRFTHFENISEYTNFHGQSWPFIGFEELTTWPNDECYRYLMTCHRSTRGSNMPLLLRATTNPSGVGHNWVMIRFRLPLAGFPHQMRGPLIDDDRDERGTLLPERRYIHSKIEENLLMLANDPGYIDRICAGATSESQYRAFRYGDWSITAGGMFDDIWPDVRETCVVKSFNPPPTWRITNAFDPGSSKPFSYGLYAESDGSDLLFHDGHTLSTTPGDIFRFREWYGWNGTANKGLKHLTIPEIAEGIMKRHKAWGVEKRVRPGPADRQIFDEVNGFCANEVFAKHGVHFVEAAKGPYSRIEGWSQLRMRLKATKRINGIRETPGFFIVGENCPQFMRTVPVLPRKDGNEDDVDSESEDHVGDEVRYRLRFDSGPGVKFGRIRGM